MLECSNNPSQGPTVPFTNTTGSYTLSETMNVCLNLVLNVWMFASHTLSFMSKSFTMKLATMDFIGEAN